MSANQADWKEWFGKHHHLLMLAGCILPILLLLVLYLVLDTNSPYFWLIFLLCPLSHFFLMREMHKQPKKNSPENAKGCH